MSDNDQDNSVIFSKLDDVTKLNSSAVVTFLRFPAKTPLGVAAAEAFGSGFFIRHEQNIFLVTAAHVVHEIYKQDTVLRTEHGSSPLVNVGFAVDDEADIGVMLVDQDLFKQRITKFDTVSIERPSVEYLETSVALFMGYPNSSNKVDSRSGDAIFRLVSIDVIEKFDKSAKGSCISNARYFIFSRDKTISGMNVTAGSRTAPYPYGMSGGPVLGIFRNTENDDLQATLIGVAAEWHQQTALLVAANAMYIAVIISQLLDMVLTHKAVSQPD